MSPMDLLAIAGLIAAVALFFGIVFFVLATMKFNLLMDDLRASTKRLNRDLDALVPRLDQTLTETEAAIENFQAATVDIRDQVTKVDTITDKATSLSGNLTTLSNLATLTVAVPIVKAASLSHGVRSAISNRQTRPSRSSR